MPSERSPRFTNKIVLITGGSSGIGFAAAKKFIQEGASVAIVGRDQDTLDKAIQELGQSAFAIRADLSRHQEIEDVFTRFRARYDRLDILFANAGAPKLASVAETSEELFDQIFAGNFRASFFTVKHALPLLSHGAAIVFTTSFFDQKGIAGSSVISANKAATRSLTRTLAAELVERGIRVNAVAPGSIDTPAMSKMGMTPQQQQDSVRHNVAQIPMGRVGHAEEVANAVTFLASGEASYITGLEINVDGGRLQL
ncbi:MULTISPECIES: SDR family oxidoreductase [unclassified Caballeronia]|uniref:SDR family oxidoreductase n=1 Tax=unclassified Caballeronia TaxID=2646786 RepID=UPI002854C9E8|nr:MULTISPECIES: SDR family oxidoreductase [unclassified Caballeronia]MDR5776927.1 SDR family oxidoreductase [Caballeronia sp. LZ002]MDR5798766.1 SDR family oxidoreductase [Caballeronia sp. LZ001]MDR5852288.1 SDR family oxidoreductase [Caballeronia sp. LZ003]